MPNDRNVTWVLAAGAVGFLLGVVATATFGGLLGNRRAAQSARESEAERLDRESRDARLREAENRRINAILDEDSPIQPPRLEDASDSLATGTDRTRPTRPGTTRSAVPAAAPPAAVPDEADRALDTPADKPLDTPLDRPLDTPLDRPLDKPPDTPADRPPDRPATPRAPATRPGSPASRTPVPEPGAAPPPSRPLPPRR